MTDQKHYFLPLALSSRNRDIAIKYGDGKQYDDSGGKVTYTFLAKSYDISVERVRDICHRTKRPRERWMTWTGIDPFDIKQSINLRNPQGLIRSGFYCLQDIKDQKTSDLAHIVHKSDLKVIVGACKEHNVSLVIDDEQDVENVLNQRPTPVSRIMEWSTPVGNIHPNLGLSQEQLQDVFKTAANLGDDNTSITDEFASILLKTQPDGEGRKAVVPPVLIVMRTPRCDREEIPVVLAKRESCLQ